MTIRRTFYKLFRGFLALGVLIHSLAFAATVVNYTYSVGENSQSQAVLWITNGQGILVGTVILDSSAGSYGRAVALSGSNVYIVGRDAANAEAALWITGLDGSNVQMVLMGTDASAEGVAVANNVVYIVGRSGPSSHANLWMYNLRNSTLASSVTLAVNNLQAAAFDVAVSNSQVYITGIDDPNSVLWITNLDGSNVREISLAAGEGSSGIALSNAAVYIGEENYPSQFYTTNLSGGNIQTISTSVTNGDYQAIALSSDLNRLYLLGINGAGPEEAFLTIFDIASSLYQNLFNFPSNTTGYGIAISSLNVYSVGVDLNSNNAVLWVSDLNGSLLSTTVFGSGAAYAVATLAATTPGGSLLESLKLYSPITLLKGVYGL